VCRPAQPRRLVIKRIDRAESPSVRVCAYRQESMDQEYGLWQNSGKLA
jgi:hypothetical protein